MQRALPKPTLAALLREIVGNPFRPLCQCTGKPKTLCDPCLDLIEWTTDTVTRLARACRDGVRCGRCEGDGKAHGADRPFQWTPEVGYPGPCPKCKGTGWEQPPFDPTALRALRDALLEAGMDEGHEIAMHLEQKERCPCSATDHPGYNPCPGCGGQGPTYHYTEIHPCKECGCWENSICLTCAGKEIITKRSPCVAGCWVVDLILERA